MSKRLLFLVLLSTLVLTAAAVAEEAETDSKPEEPRPLEERLSTTQHTLTLDGEQIAYTATAGTLLLKDDKGRTTASIFHISYTRDGVEDPASRPVTFSFNGGPGAAALWVNLGAFGPKKVLADDEGMPMPPPGRLVDNPYSLLDVSDLVFIDPAGTGLSRIAEGVDREKFYGLRADVESVGEFIRLWVSRNGRWSSPKFLAGESYGTTRAAGLSHHLQQRHGMYLNGIVMISTVLNWQNSEAYPGNDLPFMIYLPSYAATAWYHKKLPQDLQGDLTTTLDEVERFALGEYALALHQGANLSAEAQASIAQKLARYTGLSVGYVERSDLRIQYWRFLKELLREEGKTVGRLDARFTGFDRDSVGEAPEFDPSMTGVNIGYVTLMNDYIRRELGHETDLVYRSLSRSVRPWKWEGHDNRFVNVAEDLRMAIVRNHDLHVLFTSGYYDFATPYFDTDYTVTHLGLPESLRKNVEIRYYEAGHMMYIKTTEHEKLKRDIVELIERSLGSPSG